MSQLISLVTLLACLLLSTVRSHAIAPRQASEPVTLVHQFPAGTWVENVGVRSNGKILAITITSPLLYQLDPEPSSDVTVAYNFSAGGNALQSITELYDDVFYVHVQSCTILKNLSCTPGSSSVWGIDLYQQPPKAREVAKFPTAKLLNGAAALNREKGLIVLSDSILGGIWTLNVHTGAHSLTIRDPTMSGNGSVGINGVRVRPGELWFDNSVKGTLNRIPIDLNTGEATGEAVTVATGLNPDDFELDLIPRPRKAYVANAVSNELAEVDVIDGTTSVLAGGPPGIAFSGPTSARWGKTARDRRRGSLYVSTIGGLQQYLEGNVTIGGAVSRVDLR
jgi:hypothetical protein